MFSPSWFPLFSWLFWLLLPLLSVFGLESVFGLGLGLGLESVFGFGLGLGLGLGFETWGFGLGLALAFPKLESNI